MDIREDSEEDFDLPLFFLLSWEDIWLSEILPMLTLEDLFRLRAVCKAAHQLVKIHFARLKKLDITNKRTFTLEAYQVYLSYGLIWSFIILASFSDCNVRR